MKKSKEVDWKNTSQKLIDTIFLILILNKIAEFELVIENEHDLRKEPKNSGSTSTQPITSILDSSDFTEEELMKHGETIKEDKTFVKFKDTISVEPEQVLTVFVFITYMCFFFPCRL